jgi:alkanesulfonate monooxygenase SsuD/methylene tetrahydromethanopterin reductase-like flavin-dependent oxidoreductase (luciferase family)
MARTVDHISAGRLILGIGAGWKERDYLEYGYTFGTAPDRVRAFGQAMPLIVERLGKLIPLPKRHIPILIGAGGEKVMLRRVAQYADIWNAGGSVEEFKHKNAVLDGWCEKVGRDPASIERSLLVGMDQLDILDAYLEVGATHYIFMLGSPFDFAGVERLLRWRENKR